MGGFDGWDSNTVEQTERMRIAMQDPSYYVWYEFSLQHHCHQKGLDRARDNFFGFGDLRRHDE